MVTLNQGNNEVLQELRYQYDNSGNITQIEDKVKNTTQAFLYDALDRLTQASGEYGTLNYRYDSIGNLLEKEGTSYQYGAKPHAATQVGNTALTYHANGNLIAKGGKQFKYDIENRLTEVQDGATITSFTHDGDGGRVKKTTGSDSTTYIGSLFEIDSDGTTRKHIFAGSTRVCTINSTNSTNSTNSINYSHSDHLNSSTVTSDSQGQASQTITYKPFGEVYKSQGSDTTKHKFTGKELDESGLYFYGARYYDPEVGRFISADTVVQSPYDPQDLNRYAYCRNNPINYIDPTGHGFWAIFIAVAVSVAKGAAVGAVIGGAVSAATGGDIGKEFLNGAINGAIFGFVGGLQLQGISHTIGHTIAGSVSGAINAYISGSNMGMGALVGGASAGASEWLGSNVGFLKPVAGRGLGGYLNNVARRAAIGGIVGGGVSAAFGGNFGYGARQGATTAAIAYTANEFLHEVAKALNSQQEPRPTRDVTKDSNKQNTTTNTDSPLAPTPGRLLRWGAAILKAAGFIKTGTALGAAGLALEPGGWGKLSGIIVGGATGVKVGAGIGTAIYPGPGTFIGGVVGGIGGGIAGGQVGSQIFDDPSVGNLNYNEWE